MKRIHKAALVVSIIIVFACVGIEHLYHASLNLVQRSELLGDAQGWTFSTGHDPYLWLTESTLFATIDEGARKPFLYDIRTDKTIIMEPLRKLFEGDSTGDKVRTWDLAPDHTHIVWCKWNQSAIHTATLAGLEHHVWSFAGRGDVTSVDYVSWLNDGHRWIASASNVYGPDQRAFLGNADGPTSKAPIGMDMSRAELLETADPIRYTASRGLTIQREVIGKSGRRIVNVPPPARIGMFDCEIDPSPDRKHLVWHFQNSRIATLDALINKLLPSHRTQPQIYCSMWISRIDGTNMKEVGRMEVAVGYPAGIGPKEFEWMPDGTRISYIYNGHLYAIDVSGCL